MSGIITNNIGITSGLKKVIPAGGNTPMFYARRGAIGCSGDGCSQNLSDNTFTKAEMNGEFLDTDSCYDTSTYRFTPNKAGKYFLFAKLFMGEHQDRGINFEIEFRFNGNQFKMTGMQYEGDFQSDGYDKERDYHTAIQAVKEFNGTSDYVELWARVDQSSSYARIWGAGQSYHGSYWGGFKI